MNAETGGTKTPHLVRVLGLPDCTFFVVGSMIGTGIFLSAGNAARKVPHPSLLLLVWVLGGIHALAAAFTYAELGARRPDAAGAYTYIAETFGALPAFLYNWAWSFVIQPGSVAALSVGFAEFLGVFFPALGTHVTAFTIGGVSFSEGQLVALATSFAFTSWNILGIREGSGLNNVLTVVKIGSLVAFVAFGLAAPAAHAPSFGGALPMGLLGSVGGALAGVIWSYDGWNNVTALGAEVKNPARNLAGGLVIGVLVVIALYLAANFVYLCAAPVSILGASPRAAETASRILFGPGAARWLSAAVLVSILGSLSANIVPAPRMLYATARDGRLPKAFGRLHPKFATPAFGLMFQALLGAALTLSGTFDQIVATVVSAGVVFYALGGAAIFVYRRRQPDTPFRCPAYPFTPALYVGASLVFCAAVTVDAPLDAAKGLVLLAAGVIVYAWQEWRRTIVRSTGAVLVVLSMLAVPARAAGPAKSRPYSIAPKPAWVEDVPVPENATAPKDQISDGVYHLLQDEQVDAASRTTFAHHARLIFSEVGIENGNELSFDFDPSWERLTLHTIAIHRGGKTLNALRPEKIKVIQREADLEMKMFDGRLSAVVVLEDVRVGDIVEWATSRQGSNPILGNRFVDDFYVQWSSPLKHFRYRLLWPKGRTLLVKNHRTAIVPEVRPRPGGGEERIWAGTDVPALLADRQVPSWYDPWGWVQLSEFASWADVTAWALPLYHVETPPAVREAALRFAKPPLAPSQFLLAALRFVQEDVRYLGIELGPQSHQPHPPGLVLARRFGDCKDKSLLLVSLLRALDIDAVPALVHTSRRQALDDWLPSPYAFNHVIVRVTLDGRTYWLDPTRSQQRGNLDRLYQPGFRRALAVAEGTVALEKVPDTPSVLGRTSVYEELVVKDFKGPVTLRVRTVAEGVKADRLRSTLASASRAETEKDYVNYYARRYSKVTPAKPLEMEDDDARNVLVTREEYKVEGFWTKSEEKKRLETSFYPQEIRDAIVEPSTPQRTMPLRLPYPDDTVVETLVRLPEKWVIKPTKHTIENSAFRFVSEASLSGPTLTFRYELESKSDAVDVKALEGYRSDVKRVLDVLGWEIYKSTEPPAPPKPFLTRLNGPVVALSALFVGMCAYGSFRAWRWRFTKPPRMVPPEDAALSGIGGWLILLALGIVLRPFTLLVTIVKNNGSVFIADDWAHLSAPYGASSSPLWGPLLLGELLGNLALFAMAVLIAFCFFAKKRAFPGLMVAYIVAYLVVVLADSAATAALVEGKSNAAAGGWTDLAGTMVMAVVWIPYLLVSRRVRATFLH